MALPRRNPFAKRRPNQKQIRAAQKLAEQAGGRLFDLFFARSISQDTFGFNPALKRFVINNKALTPKAVRADINRLLEFAETEAERLGKQTVSKKKTPAEFTNAMYELLLAAHILAAAIGRGGEARMRQADWRKMGAKLKWQAGYLTRFGRLLARGVMTEAGVTFRAKLYASAVYVSFSRTWLATMRGR